jgi:maleate isomerase
VAAEVTRNNDIGRMPPESAIELGLKADRPDADVLFLACGNWWTVPVIEALEARVGKPVLTTNNVAIWQVLSMLGGHRSVPGFGRLLREMPAAPGASADKAA